MVYAVPSPTTTTIAHGPHLLHFHKLWVHNLIRKVLKEVSNFFSKGTMYLVGLLEYVDKLRSIFSILLGEKGVGCASVAFAPCSTNPGDNVVVEYVQILAGSA